MHRIDGAGHVNNMWVSEDPATARPPTEITADWQNAVQEELVNLVLKAGLPLDKGDNTQLWQAVMLLLNTAITNLVNAAPGALDTLKELSDALGGDANFATTVANLIAQKLNLSGGTMTGPLLLSEDATQPLQAVTLRQFQSIASVPTKLSQLTNDGNFLQYIEPAYGMDLNDYWTPGKIGANYTGSEKNFPIPESGTLDVSASGGMPGVPGSDTVFVQWFTSFFSRKTFRRVIYTAGFGYGPWELVPTATDFMQTVLNAVDAEGARGVLNAVAMSASFVATENIDNYKKHGFYVFPNGALNIGIPFFLSVIDDGTGILVSQMRIDFPTGKVKTRTYYNGGWNPWSDGASMADIPTDTSQLTNGAGFLSVSNSVYTGNVPSNLNYPVGSYLQAGGSTFIPPNAPVTVRYNTGNGTVFTVDSIAAAQILTGTWVARGWDNASSLLVQRIA